MARRVNSRSFYVSGFSTPSCGSFGRIGEANGETSELTPAVERYYDVLVRLVCGFGGERLMEGQGNFGSVCVGHPENPPAHPCYTEVPNHAARVTVSR
jgi:hypothetical protein